MINEATRQEIGAADGEIIVFTANVRLYKGSPVLVVGNNKLIFINASAIRKGITMSREEETIAEGFIVKLNKDNFKKIYSFKHDFDGFAFDKEDTFESLSEIAKKQNDDRDIINRRGKIRMFYLENSIESL